MKPTSWPCGTAPASGEAYEWFTTELSNLRTAFRWAADIGDLDVAATIATNATILGFWIENYEPITWAEELIEPARAANHPQLATLYVLASQCYMAGRIEAALQYSEAGQALLGTGRFAVPFGVHGMLGAPYMAIGQPQRWADFCSEQLARGRDAHGVTWSSLVFALTMAGSTDEALAAADGLVEAAESTGNPQALSSALLVYGSALEMADPERALSVLRRGMVIARDSGIRFNETMLAFMLSRLEAVHGDSLGCSGRCRRWPLATSTTPPIPTTSAPLWPCSPSSWTGSDATSRQPPSPASPSIPMTRGGVPRDQHRDRPPRERPRRPDLRIARPQGRDDDHRRHGDLRIRPNRPGPSRTEGCLEIVVGPLWGRRVSGKIGGGRSPRSSVLGAGEPVK